MMTTRLTFENRGLVVVPKVPQAADHVGPFEPRGIEVLLEEVLQRDESQWPWSRASVYICSSTPEPASDLPRPMTATVTATAGRSAMLDDGREEG